MVRYLLIVLLCIFMLFFIATSRAIGEVKQWTAQDCRQYAADQVKELMALHDQQAQLNIMRKEKICGKESAFNCYTKLLKKLERMCVRGELKEE